LLLGNSPLVHCPPVLHFLEFCLIHISGVKPQIILRNLVDYLLFRCHLLLCLNKCLGVQMMVLRLWIKVLTMMLHWVVPMNRLKSLPGGDRAKRFFFFSFHNLLVLLLIFLKLLVIVIQIFIVMVQLPYTDDRRHHLVSFKNVWLLFKKVRPIHSDACWRPVIFLIMILIWIKLADS
jgi:hypothetical protein